MTTTQTNAAADTADQAAAAPAAAAAAPAAPSKMDKAKVLFAGLRDGSIATLEGKTARATFIATMQQPEFGMTPAGAATYWQNLVSKEKGGKLYPHTGKAGKKAEAGKTDAPETPEVPAEEPAAEGKEPAANAPAEQERAEDDVSHLA